MSATGDRLVRALRERGIDPDRVAIDPALPELKLEKGGFAKWIKTFRDVDEACLRQVEPLRGSPLIPDEVAIHGYVWEVESMRLRRPAERLAEKVNTANAMGVKG